MFEITIANADERDKHTELELPASTEQVRAAFERIGLDSEGHRDYTVTGHRTTADGILDCLYPDDTIDDLNFLASRLKELDEAELNKLAAVIETKPEMSLPELIDLTYNLDYYIHIPEVNSFEELGRYYLYQYGMVEMPEEWKAAIPLETFGKNAAEKEHGRFTPRGYLLKSDDEWEPHYNGSNIPEKYRVTSYPNQPETRFPIYQLKETDDTRPLRWQSYDDQIASGQKTEIGKYKCVYSGETLATIFEKYNLNRPENFAGHSLSVSDVIVIEQEGLSAAHYVDRTGFKWIDDFFKKEAERYKQPKAKPPQKRHKDHGSELYAASILRERRVVLCRKKLRTKRLSCPCGRAS